MLGVFQYRRSTVLSFESYQIIYKERKGATDTDKDDEFCRVTIGKQRSIANVAFLSFHKKSSRNPNRFDPSSHRFADVFHPCSWNYIMVSINMGSPIAGSFISWKIGWFGGTPVLGNLHIVILECPNCGCCFTPSNCNPCLSTSTRQFFVPKHVDLWPCDKWFAVTTGV